MTKLEAVLAKLPDLAIAVSGGVDSMTLAHAAHRAGLPGLLVVHALSPAVPMEATDRVRDHASRFGWRLTEVDAGEFADPAYRANPVNRCYFCKTNLYDRIRALSPYPIASGANLDDLGDYRPGLLAAAERAVVHPYIEAGMDKAAVRALARALGADDVAELPAQPCLASRVETGIAIDAADLAFVDHVETTLARALPPAATLRCRITRTGVAIEVGEEVGQIDSLAQAAARLCRDDGRAFAGVRRYRRGAMFVRT